MKKITKNLLLLGLVISFNSCSVESILSDNESQRLDYQQSIKYANKFNLDLENFFENRNFKNQKVNKNELVKEFIENHTDETISELLIEIGEKDKLIYSANFSDNDIDISDVDKLDMSKIEKEYLIELYKAASTEDSEKTLMLLDDFKNDLSSNSELNNLNLIFAFIETNQGNLLAHKNSLVNKASDCGKAAEVGGILGGVFGMIKGCIVGGVTGSVLGMNPGTGAAGAVVGAVGGGVVGFAEGAILGYIGCKIFG